MQTDLTDDDRRKLAEALAAQDVGHREVREPFDLQALADDADRERRPLDADLPENKLVDPSPKMATGMERRDEARARPMEGRAYFGETKPDDESPAKKPEKGFDLLGAIAAFTQNPVLLEKMRHRDEAPKRELEAKLAKNRDAREQQKADLERDLYAPLKAQGMQQKNALAAGQAQAFDPAHPYSQAMRQGISQRLAMEADRLPDGHPLKDHLKQAATGIASNSKLSAAQAMQVAGQFGDLGNKAVHDAHQAAQFGEAQKMNEAKRAQMSDQSKQALARIDAARQKALAPRTDARTRAAQVKNQEKLDDEIEKADWARNNLLSIADLKKHVNTGPLAGRWQSALQDVDMASPEFNAMKQRLAMVSNRIIKELSGSAVTGNEWARMKDELANILNDDSNFDTKLANMIELTETIKQRAINRYARNEGGAPTNPTNTAAMSSAQQPKTMPGEQKPAGPGGKTEAPQQNASSKYQIGQTATNKATGEQVRWDGQRWVPLK